MAATAVLEGEERLQVRRCRQCPGRRGGMGSGDGGGGAGLAIGIDDGAVDLAGG
jgi:hypothetical protein